MNLVDSSAWIEFFVGGNNASFFSKAIVDTQSLIVPVICLYEVFKKVNQVADEGRALEVIAQMKQGRVIPISEEIVLANSCEFSLLNFAKSFIKYFLSLALSLLQ